MNFQISMGILYYFFRIVKVMKSRPILKIISLYTLLSFLLTQTGFAELSQTLHGLKNFHEGRSTFPPPTLSVPPELGSVTETWGTSPALILIQDAHGQLQAQKNIGRILNFLKKSINFSTLFIEGGVGRLDANLLRLFEEDRYNLEAARLLIEQSEIGSPELFLLEDLVAHREWEEKADPKQSARVERRIKAFGVEDPAFFVPNVKSFQRVIEKQSKSEPFLRSRCEKIQQTASRFFSPDLYKFFKAWVRYEETAGKPEGDLLGYLSSLDQAAKQILQMNFSDPRAQLAWPMLVRFYELKRREHKLRYEEANAEHEKIIAWAKKVGIRQGLIDDLQRRGKVTSPLEKMAGTASPRVQADSFEVHEKPLDLRTFWELFYHDARVKGFQFSDYPNFSFLEGFRILDSEIDIDELMKEIGNLREEILRALVQRDEDWEIIQQFRNYLLLKKLFSLTLTRDEFLEIQKHEPRFVSGAGSGKALSPDLSVSGEGGGLPHQGSGDPQKRGAAPFVFLKEFPEEIRGIYREAIEFYDLAVRRDEIMVSKIQKVIQSEGVERSVLVTGGFHTPGLTAILREKKIPYVVIAPRMSEIESDKGYVASMMGKEQTVDPFQSSVRFANFLNPVKYWEGQGLSMARRRSQLGYLRRWGEKQGAKLRETRPREFSKAPRAEARMTEEELRHVAERAAERVSQFHWGRLFENSFFVGPRRDYVMTPWNVRKDYPYQDALIDYVAQTLRDQYGIPKNQIYEVGMATQWKFVCNRQYMIQHRGR
ncbi:MAG: hypothetical protein NC930_07675, partial [Candidatus Omnitrophica bacterium]|nr:hypothetical protein [Candidatus Omnitrophota bacterium]